MRHILYVKKKELIKYIKDLKIFNEIKNWELEEINKKGIL